MKQKGSGVFAQHTFL